MQQWLGSAIIIIAAVAVMGSLAVVAVWLRRRMVRRGQQGDAAGTAAAEVRRQQVDDDVRDEGSQPWAARSLTDAERAVHARRWNRIEHHAAAQPATALLDADDTVSRLLDDLGYATGRFVEDADASRGHSAVVDDYRAARNVVFDARLGLAGTAEIREATRRYRRVFERLAETTVSTGVDETAASGGHP